MRKSILFPIGLCLLLALGLTVFLGCQESGFADVNSPADQGISLSAEDLSVLIEKYIPSENELILIGSFVSEEDAEGASAVGETSGGVQFAQFTGREAGLWGWGLYKTPDATCSMSVGAGLRAQKRFAGCVMDDLESCSGGGSIHIDGGSVHYHSSC